MQEKSLVILNKRNIYMNNSSLISIIIATYNAEKTIKRAIDSCLNQKYPYYEILVIDGKSTDNTISILKDEYSQYNNIKYISEKDKGIYDALNKGIQLAKGDWIYILGADDELLPDGLLCLMKESQNYDIIYGDTIDRTENNKTHYFHAKHYSIIKYIMFCCHQGLIMRRDVILKLNGFNTKYPIRADFDLIQRSFLAGYKFKQINIPIAYFATTGVSSTSNLKNDIERLYILRNNKSTRLPFMVFSYYFFKRITRVLIHKLSTKYND